MTTLLLLKMSFFSHKTITLFIKENLECYFFEFAQLSIIVVLFSAWDKSRYPGANINKPKPSLKIESVNKAFLFCYWQRPKKMFFRNKTFFLFFKAETFSICSKMNLVKPHKVSIHSAHSDSCYLHFFFW